jgi:hypothetical protein
MVFLEEGKEPLGGEKVRFFKKVSLRWGVEGAFDEEKVGSLGRVVSPRELTENLIISLNICKS